MAFCIIYATKFQWLVSYTLQLSMATNYHNCQTKMKNSRKLCRWMQKKFCYQCANILTGKYRQPVDDASQKKLWHKHITHTHTVDMSTVLEIQWPVDYSSAVIMHTMAMLANRGSCTYCPTKFNAFPSRINRSTNYRHIVL